MGLAQEQQQQHDLSSAPWTSQWPGLLTGILLTSMTAGLMQHQPLQQHLRMRVTQMSALIQARHCLPCSRGTCCMYDEGRDIDVRRVRVKVSKLSQVQVKHVQRVCKFP